MFVAQAAVPHIARAMLMGCIPITSRTPYSALNETTWPFDLGPPPAAGAGREAPGAGARAVCVCVCVFCVRCVFFSEREREREREKEREGGREGGREREAGAACK